ncbi:MAG: hypothetical protein K8T90_16335 [Planctomycetes bacterium]|nr:hypothetical protein [Planctomycetota bacterium]
MRGPGLPVAAIAALVTCVVTAGAAHSATAEDTVDLAVAGNATVAGTIRPATERESFVLTLGRGARVSAIATAKSKRGGFVPQIDLVDGAFGSVAIGTTKGRRSALRTAAPVAVGGDHRLRVFGDGVADGEYGLSLTVSSKARFSETGDAPPGGGLVTFRFGAVTGATVRLAIDAVGRAATSEPALDAIVSPTGRRQALSGAASPPIRLDEPGDWTVEFHDATGRGGAYVATAKLKLPRARPSRIDVTAANLTGDFGSSQPVFGRYVTADGALIEPPDTGGALDGSSVDVPPGAMPYAAVITISETTPFDGLGTDRAAGPAVRFSPDGLSFAPPTKALVTIPYDPESFTDPESELTVYVQNETTGDVTPVDKPYGLETPGRVSFATSHFSIYLAGSSRPKDVAGDWVVASLRAATEAEYGGRTTATVGTLTFDRAGGAFAIDDAGLQSVWARGTPSFATVSAAGGPHNGTFTEASPTRIVLDESPLPQRTFVRRASGDAIVLASSPGDSAAELTFALRKAVGPATIANVTGRWQLVEFAAGATQATAGAPVELVADAIRGTATFAADGRATLVRSSVREARSDFPAGMWDVAKRSVRASGTLDASGGALRLSFGGRDGPEPPITLHACLGGGVLLGARTDPASPPTLLVFVREAGTRPPEVLRETTRTTDLAVHFLDALAPGSAQRSYFSEVEGSVEYRAGDAVAYSPTFGRAFDYAAGGAPIAAALGVESDVGTHTFGSNGAYHDSFGFNGALTPGGEILIGVLFDESMRLGFSVALPGATDAP